MKNFNATTSRRTLLTHLVALSAIPVMGSSSAAATAPASKAAIEGAKGPFSEPLVRRDGHRIYVRDYPGKGPAFVMIHGFPDNCRIYEELAVRLSSAGRRVVTFDFLGFGASDKPAAFTYSFEQQLADLSFVVASLKLKNVIVVGHDAGGPAAVNYALDNPSAVDEIVLFNSYYADGPTRAFPDFIELCSNPKTRLLAHAMMNDPAQAAYLFGFQQNLLRENMTPAMRVRWDEILQPIIAENFTQTPSAMPAFLAMTGNAYENLAYNNTRLEECRAFQKPVRLIWGSLDKYLGLALAKDIASSFPNARLFPVDAEHWPQFDKSAEVAALMLA